MPVAECMQRVSHREYLLWLELFQAEWNEPTRSDHYLMQVAAEIRRVNVKNPGKVKLESYKLSFMTVGSKQQQTDKEKYAKQAKSVWAARVKAWRQPLKLKD